MNIPELSPLFADQPGAHAARRLFEMTRCDERASEVIAHFLVSLHNNQFAAPDLYLLCRSLDDDLFDDAIDVMTWFRDAPGRCDLKEIFGSEGESAIGELMARFGLMRPPRY